MYYFGKRHFLYYYLLLAAMCLFFTSCKKDRCDAVEAAPEEFLSYWYFPKGSWWVYQLKDSVGVYDTVRVVRTYTIEPDDDYPFCIRRYKCHTEHSNKTYFPDQASFPDFEQFSSFYEEDRKKWVVSQYSQGTGHRHYHYLFAYPFYMYMPIRAGVVILDKDTLRTPAGTFGNTVHVKANEATDTIVAPALRHVYLTKEVGITKIHYSGPEIWELANYHINK